MEEKIHGIKSTNPKYVSGQEDPRSTPLNQCVSLGDLMFTLQRCRELDEEEIGIKLPILRKISKKTVMETLEEEL